jgi:hypothetical protein
MKGKKVVARAAARNVTAKTARVTLKLSHKLARGTYTVKAIAVRSGQEKVSRVALKAAR